MQKLLHPSCLIGKTIKNVDSQALNVWHVECTDGLKVSIISPTRLLGNEIVGLSIKEKD